MPNNGGYDTRPDVNRHPYSMLGPIPTRIADKIEVDDCWIWTAATDRDGYGVTQLFGRQWRTARLIWELLVGPLGELTIDHLCRVKACVNPDHLEPVTASENTRRRPSRRPWNYGRKLA